MRDFATETKTLPDGRRVWAYPNDPPLDAAAQRKAWRPEPRETPAQLQARVRELETQLAAARDAEVHRG